MHSAGCIGWDLSSHFVTFAQREVDVTGPRNRSTLGYVTSPLVSPGFFLWETGWCRRVAPLGVDGVLCRRQNRTLCTVQEPLSSSTAVLSCISAWSCRSIGNQGRLGWGAGWQGGDGNSSVTTPPASWDTHTFCSDRSGLGFACR